MAIEIQPYSTSHENAVRELNQRLKAGGCPFRFPESSKPAWLPPSGDDPIYEEFFVASEAEAVRGGYILKRQPFWLRGSANEVGCVYLPLSEGAVDGKYSRVALQLLMNALKKQPLLYSLGMGGFHNPYPTMLKAAGWKLCAVPFYFAIFHPTKFLRNFTLLRRRPPVRIALDVLAATGLGAVLIGAMNSLLQLRSFPKCEVECELVPEFSHWTDALWKDASDNYSLAAVRDSRSLNRLYPSTKEKFLRLKISQQGKVVGWAVCLDTPMTQHKQFGAMRVGSVIDCLALAGRERAVAQGATQFLKGRGADMVVSNQSHVDWQKAFSKAGYWRGPSNYIFAASPKLAEKAGAINEQGRIHMNRGDGEGPSHL